MYMSIENVKNFFEKLQDDKELQNELTSIYKGKQREIKTKIVKIGSEVGYEFSEADFHEMIEEITDSMQQSEQLDDNQLEEIAGGNEAAWDTLTQINYTVCVFTAVHHCDLEMYLRKTEKEESL